MSEEPDQVSDERSGREADGVALPDTSTTYRTPDDHNHYVELDSLRGLAIWAVVMHHTLSVWRGIIGPVRLPEIGWDLLEVLHFLPGVPLFYLLSGYLLTWTEGKRAASGNYGVKSYAMRRILRIVPAYYVAIVVVLIVWPIPVSAGDLISHLTFTHGFTPYARTMSSAFWSLTPEIVFYVILPLFILKLTSFRARLITFLLLFALSIPFKIIARNSIEYLNDTSIEYGDLNPYEFFSSFPATLLYLFFIGMLVRMFVERLNSKPRSRWQGPVTFAVFLVTSVYLVTTPGLGFLRVPSLGSSFAQFELSLLNDLMLTGFFASAVLGAPVLRNFLRWRVLSFVGLISYSMFVFHQTILLLIRRNFLQNPDVQAAITQSDTTLITSFVLYILVAFSFIIIVAYLGYRFIEKPFLRIKPK